MGNEMDKAYSRFVWIIVLVIIAMIVLNLISTITLYHTSSNLPSNLSFKSVENTGGLFGNIEYYAFDTNGKRYHITQEKFDSLINVEKK